MEECTRCVIVSELTVTPLSAQRGSGGANDVPELGDDGLAAPRLFHGRSFGRASWCWLFLLA
jgi:hypothetical protein